MLNDIVIAGYVRSAFTAARKGALATVRPDDLAAEVVRELVARSGIDASGIEDIFLGCAFPEGEQGLNLARLVGLLAGLPLSVAGVTLNRFCGSSMQAIHSAAGAIRMEAGECFICAGVESMTRVPMMGFNPLPNPRLNQMQPGAYMSMGDTAENVARCYQVTRADQEDFAVASHRKASAVDFSDEIVRVGEAIKDGCIRPDTTAEVLAGLSPVFQADGTITAGTSSPLTDGAAAVLVCSADYARRNSLEPLAKIKAIAVSGCEPEIMGMGPVHASRKALARAGLSASNMDIVEINEAFASQAIACLRELAIDEACVNLEGGAIALGHPLGASGARITGKAAQLLKRRDTRYALATQCIGGGQGIATILEAC